MKYWHYVAIARDQQTDRQLKELSGLYVTANSTLASDVFDQLIDYADERASASGVEMYYITIRAFNLADQDDSEPVPAPAEEVAEGVAVNSEGHRWDDGFPNPCKLAPPNEYPGT